jgi:lipid-binding SYLF domain-containing protein
MNLSSFTVVATFVVATLIPAQSAIAAETADELRQNAQASLDSLYAKNPGAQAIGKDAVAVLVFPEVVRAGVGVGGEHGEGVLFRGGKVAGYYSTSGGSIGVQLGGQKYGYALFFLSEETLKDFAEARGFEIGGGPPVVYADEGTGKSATSKIAGDKIYAFVFDQKGAMFALGIQGSRISKIKK